MPSEITKPLSTADAAIVQLIGELLDLKGQMGSIVAIQGQLADQIEAHSKTSAAAQAALLQQIQQVKNDNAQACQLHTGNQREAVEKLQMERRMADHDTRSKLEAYERERTDIIHRLNKVCDRLEKGDRKIARGEMAFNILKWAGIVIGGLLLTAAVVKLFLSGETIRIGQAHAASVAGIVSYGVAKIWGAWLFVAGVVAAIVDFRAKHLGG